MEGVYVLKSDFVYILEQKPNISKFSTKGDGALAVGQSIWWAALESQILEAQVPKAAHQVRARVRLGSGTREQE